MDMLAKFWFPKSTLESNLDVVVCCFWKHLSFYPWIFMYHASPITVHSVEFFILPIYEASEASLLKGSFSNRRVYKQTSSVKQDLYVCPAIVVVWCLQWDEGLNWLGECCHMFLHTFVSTDPEAETGVDSVYHPHWTSSWVRGWLAVVYHLVCTGHMRLTARMIVWSMCLSMVFYLSLCSMFRFLSHPISLFGVRLV